MVQLYTLILFKTVRICCCPKKLLLYSSDVCLGANPSLNFVEIHLILFSFKYLIKANCIDNMQNCLQTFILVKTNGSWRSCVQATYMGPLRALRILWSIFLQTNLMPQSSTYRIFWRTSPQAYVKSMHLCAWIWVDSTMRIVPTISVSKLH